jgi:hypothetical protein
MYRLEEKYRKRAPVLVLLVGMKERKKTTMYSKNYLPILILRDEKEKGMRENKLNYMKCVMSVFGHGPCSL